MQMQTPQDRPFDIVLWGATGYTGRLVASELAQHREAPKIRLALGGRDKSKLERVAAELSPHKLAELSIITGDAGDSASLQAIAAKARVVCTTVGPYAKYGSGLVAACAAQGTHYCDLTGEVQWMRRMIDAHHEEAERTGARIVHACGFDSIPSDLGVFMVQERLMRQLGKPAVRITGYLGEGTMGVSGGTIASAMNLAEEMGRDPSLRKLMVNPFALDPAPPPLKESIADRDPAGIQYDRTLKVFTCPFVMGPVNTRIVRRTHALLGRPWGREFHYREVQSFPASPKGFSLAMIATGGLYMMTGVLGIPSLRKIAASKLPKPGEGPSAEERRRGFFVYRFVGETAVLSGEPVTESLGIVSDHRDPGYGSTSVMLSESALCLALDDLPAKGGVLTPASSMGMTLVERLRASGFRMDVQPLHST